MREPRVVCVQLRQLRRQLRRHLQRLKPRRGLAHRSHVGEDAVRPELHGATGVDGESDPV